MVHIYTFSRLNIQNLLFKLKNIFPQVFTKVHGKIKQYREMIKMLFLSHYLGIQHASPGELYNSLTNANQCFSFLNKCNFIFTFTPNKVGKELNPSARCGNKT